MRRGNERNKWPDIDSDLVAKLVKEGPTLLELQELSPLKGDNLPSDAASIIDALFPGDPLICVGLSSSEFATRPRSEWRDQLDSMQLITPSPMSRKYGRRKKDNRPSQHTLDNTGPRCYLVVEFDSGTFDAQAALLTHLGTFAPLVAVVHSGGKSAHGWFPCRDVRDLHVEKFFRYAVSIGADPATWTRSQFVRLPKPEFRASELEATVKLSLRQIQRALQRIPWLHTIGSGRGARCRVNVIQETAFSDSQIEKRDIHRNRVLDECVNDARGMRAANSQRGSKPQSRNSTTNDGITPLAGSISEEIYAYPGFIDNNHESMKSKIFNRNTRILNLTAGLLAVENSAGTSEYNVDLGRWKCGCPDFTYRGGRKGTYVHLEWGRDWFIDYLRSVGSPVQSYPNAAK